MDTEWAQTWEEIIKDKHRTETSWKQSHGINKRTDTEVNTNTCVTQCVSIHQKRDRGRNIGKR